MSREFDGVDDLMTYSGSVPNLSGALTILIVVKILVAADNTWLSFIEHENSGSAKPSLGRTNGGVIYMSNSAANQTAISITDSDGWMIVACTKATGSATPRMHKCIIGGANTHTDAGGTLGNDGTMNTIRIGGNDDFANIRVAAAATWAGTALTDANINGINSAATTQSILDLSPSWCVDDSDAFATDLTAGTIDRTALVGTTDSADDPTGWVYFGGGGAAPTVKNLAALGVG